MSENIFSLITQIKITIENKYENQNSSITRRSIQLKESDNVLPYYY